MRLQGVKLAHEKGHEGKSQLLTIPLSSIVSSRVCYVTDLTHSHRQAKEFTFFPTFLPTPDQLCCCPNITLPTSERSVTSVYVAVKLAVISGSTLESLVYIKRYKKKSWTSQKASVMWPVNVCQHLRLAPLTEMRASHETCSYFNSKSNQ